MAITFIYAAGYAPYIADYSRYLPQGSSTAATMWWTYAGIALSGIWLFVLGAYLTSVTGFSFDTLGEVLNVTNAFSPVFTALFVVVILLIQVLQGSLSMYAGGNTGHQHRGHPAPHPGGQARPGCGFASGGGLSPSRSSA